MDKLFTKYGEIMDCPNPKVVFSALYNDAMRSAIRENGPGASSDKYIKDWCSDTARDYMQYKMEETLYWAEERRQEQAVEITAHEIVVTASRLKEFRHGLGEGV